jgi:hypothetical protein
LSILEVTSVNSLGESGLDQVVETCVVIIHQLAHVGTLVEAVCQGCVRLGRHDWHASGKMSSDSGGEGGMTGLVTLQTVSLVAQPSSMIMICQMQFLGSRQPQKMVSPLRVTLQPVLWENTVQPTLHRMAMERR